MCSSALRFSFNSTVSIALLTSYSFVAFSFKSGLRRIAPRVAVNCALVCSMRDLVPFNACSSALDACSSALSIESSIVIALLDLRFLVILLH